MSARPFTEAEFTSLTTHFSAAGKTRDVLLLKLGCGTGYRISELLALRVRDVWTGTGVAKVQATLLEDFLTQSLYVTEMVAAAKTPTTLSGTETRPVIKLFFAIARKASNPFNAPTWAPLTAPRRSKGAESWSRPLR